MQEAAKHLRLLGLKVKDRVTGFTGVVTSIGFDLYGCVQAVVTPQMATEAKLEDARWFDTSRLEILHNVPVMTVPTFVPKGNGIVSGGFEKPMPR